MKINKKIKNVGSIYFINLKKMLEAKKAIYIGLQHILKLNQIVPLPLWTQMEKMILIKYLN